MTDLVTLRDHLSRNRFMPTPPAELMFCGDGDFRAIGAEFLERLVRDAGLERRHRVLDIGCGVGRLAIPLTQYLDAAGSYDGVDPVAAGIAWCTATITPAYPNARFLHLDLHHPLYNPHGSLKTALTPLPFPNGSFDFVSMISVTDSSRDGGRPTLRQRNRAPARPRRQLFCNRLFDELSPRAPRWLPASAISPSIPAGEGPLYYANPDTPLAAVGYDEDVLTRTVPAQPPAPPRSCAIRQLERPPVGSLPGYLRLR